MRILFAAAAVLATAACASAGPTPYQAASKTTFGHSDQRIEQDRHRILFEGNSRTSRRQVEDGLLLHAANVTLANGGEWFRVVTRATDPKVTRTRAPSSRFDASFMVWRSWHPRYGWVVHANPFWHPRGPFDDWDVTESTRFEASAEILIGRGPRPENDPDVFSAREVQANLAPRLAPPPAEASRRR